MLTHLLFLFAIQSMDAGAHSPNAKSNASIEQTPETSSAFPGQYAVAPSMPVSAKGCRSKFSSTAERLECLKNLVEDYSRLQRYANANASLSPAKKRELRVVFFGDSITDYWSQKRHGGFFPGKPYINRGIAGQTTSQMLIRFRADVISLQPKAVVILAGTNDLATGVTPIEEIQNNLMTMVELARIHKITVILASLLPVSDGKIGNNGKPIIRSKARSPELILRLNQWIAEYTRKERLFHLNYHQALMNEQGEFQAGFTDDGLHPNAEGYAVMTPLVEKVLKKALR